MTTTTRGAGDTASDTRLTAYADSSQTPPVGSVTAHGAFSSDSYPEGDIAFSTGQAFNLVTIELPYMAQGAADFLVDNIVVTADQG